MRGGAVAVIGVAVRIVGAVGTAVGGCEDVAHLTRHVEGRQQRTKCGHVERDTGDAPRECGVEDFVLAPEAGEEREATQREHAAGVRHEGDRHELADAAHVTDILLARAAVNDGASTEEEQRLEEGVRDEVEHADCGATDAEADHHVTELRDGGVGEDAFDVVLRDGDE